MAPHIPRNTPRSSSGLDRQRDPRGGKEHADNRDEVPVITAALVHVSEAERAVRQPDSLLLTAEERRWGRRRVRTCRGREVVLALPTGSVMTPGEILHVGPDWYLVVEAAEEAVLVVRPWSHEEGLRVAFEVGNRHFPLAVDGERLLVPDDTAMEQLLTRLGVAWTRDRGIFLPLGAGPHDH